MAEAHNNLGNVYRALGHLAEARWCYETAVHNNPAMSQACVSLAADLAARTALGRGVALAPPRDRGPSRTVSNYLVLLAEAAVDREQFAEAIACYQKVIDRDPEAATAHNALAWLLQEVGRLDDAEQHVRTALALRPDHGDRAAQPGRAAQDTWRLCRGRRPAFERPSMTPNAEGSRWRGWPCSCGASCPITTVRRWNNRWRAPTRRTPRGSIFCSAWLRSGMRTSIMPRPPGALARPTRSRWLGCENAAWCAIRPSTSGSFRGSSRRSIPALFQRLSGAGLATDRPVFIVGLPRSGTTLIEQILASHSQFYLGGRADRWPEKTFRRSPGGSRGRTPRSPAFPT